MKSKFKIILLTMFFTVCFGVNALADIPKFTPPPDRPFYYIYQDSYNKNYVAVVSDKPFFVSNDSRYLYSATDSKGFDYVSQNGSSYRQIHYLEGKSSYDLKVPIVASGQDIAFENGKIFFQVPRGPHWTDKVALGGILTQIRPIAIIVVGFLVLLIALRKGFRLLQTVLKGL